MNNNYSLRITLNDNLNKENVVQFLTSIEGEYFISLETGKGGENPHIQSYHKTPLQQQTLRKQFLKFKIPYTDSKGNALYSLKTLDSDYPAEYLGYLMKEDKSPITNIHTDNLEESKNHYLSYQEAKKKRKEEKKTDYEKWLEYLKEINELNPTMPRYNINNPDDIVLSLLDYYRVNKKTVRRFHLKTMIDTYNVHNNHITQLRNFLLG